MNDPAASHFGNWIGMFLFMIVFGVFVLFTPFYQKSQRKPASVYLAFVIAFALEMFGVPFSMYVLAWLFGSSMPDGILWGHTLNQYIGETGVYIGAGLMLIGALLVFFGWRTIFKRYWRKDAGGGELVTEGIYHYIRHPQYTGFFLITLGMMFDWLTLPMLIMWPLLMLLYYHLAQREEADMAREFGDDYRAYKAQTGMFFPRLRASRHDPQSRKHAV
ncbi:MAG: isoprenylcysteine carboxyl methyltransferase [Anaerolineaceae bacterium]|nr:isoprenylcysteine carboxyl methyltransferase [Anaerolineaceae bacterium]